MALGTADSRSLQVNAVYMPEQRLQLLSLCEAHRNWHSPKRKENKTFCLRSGKLVINISIWNVFTLTLVNHLYEVSFEKWRLIALIFSPNRGFGVWWGLEMNSGRFAQFLVSCWQWYLWRRNHPNSNRQLMYAKKNLTFSGFHYVLKGEVVSQYIIFSVANVSMLTHWTKMRNTGCFIPTKHRYVSIITASVLALVQ